MSRGSLNTSVRSFLTGTAAFAAVAILECACSQEIQMNQGTPREMLDAPNFQIKEYYEYYFENSYLKWFINEEGLGKEEIKEKIRGTLFPTDDELHNKITAELRDKFPVGMPLTEIISVLENAGGRCRLAELHPPDPRWSVVTVGATCSYYMPLPIPFRDKIQNPNSVTLREAGVETSEEFLALQDTWRVPLEWKTNFEVLRESPEYLLKLKFEIFHSYT